MAEPKAYEPKKLTAGVTWKWEKPSQTIQWKITKHAPELYSEAYCSYFRLVLIPHNEIWWIPFSEVRGKTVHLSQHSARLGG